MSRLSLHDGSFKRDGRFLHSQKDPLREAGLWVAGRPSLSKGIVFVLGLGAGYHLREWHRQHPQLSLVACDFDDELFQAAKINPLSSFAQILNLPAGVHGLKLASSSAGQLDLDQNRLLLLDQGYSVVRFRPAWVGLEKEFAQIEDDLLDRSIDRIRMDLQVNADGRAWPEGLDVNIKSLTAAAVSIGDDEERKLLMALRELVA